MSAFFVYDSNGNITQATTNYPNVTPPSQLLVLDQSATNAQAALAAPSNYMVQNGQLIPAVTIHIDRSQAQNGAFFIWTLNITTSDNDAHTVTLNVLGDIETLNVPVGGLQYKIAVHQSINAYQFNATASGTGLVTYTTPIGGSNVSLMPVQTYKDANGLLHIAPTQKSTLLTYYTAQVSPASVIADIGTSIGLLMQTVYGIMLPALTSGTTPTITLDANQKNAVSDITANVLPNIMTTLEDAAPVPATGQPQTYDLHYASYARHIQSASKAFNDYVSDLQTIPNLV